MTAIRTAVFRVDASVEIGTGHVMRCLTLADRLRASGFRCRFVSREHRGALTGLVRSRGYSVDALPAGRSRVTDGASHEAWLGAEWRTDAQQTLDAIAYQRPEWVVVDHYGADARWETLVRVGCDCMFVIDDLADRPHACDVLLDQNLGRTREDYARLVPPGSTVLTGPAYSLLRPEFAEWRARSLERRACPGLHRILVTMGGMDKDNTTGIVLQALARCGLPSSCHVQVVLGSQAPWFEQVLGLVATLPLQIEVIRGTHEMARLMANADFAVAAAGSTTWELCALGVPSILLVVANNQRRAAGAIFDAGAACVIDMRHSTNASIEDALRQLLENPERLIDVSHRASLVCDGLGATRVVNELLKGN